MRLRTASLGSYRRRTACNDPKLPLANGRNRPGADIMMGAVYDPMLPINTGEID
jgi:hypothetical protein